MEAEFRPGEQSNRDIVQRAVKQEVSKLRPVSPLVKTKLPFKNSRRQSNDIPNPKNRKQGRVAPSQDTRYQRKASPVINRTPERRSRSKQWRRPTRNRVSDGRAPSVSRNRQRSKNGKGRGTGPVKYMQETGTLNGLIKWRVNRFWT